MTARLAMTVSPLLLITAAPPSQSAAEVSSREAAQLGTSLTPMGATKAGNKEGTIPPWTGGITKPLPGYKKGDHHADPFAGDRPRLVINAKNLDEHRPRLSEGHVALLKKYSSFELRVYPTRRSAAFPPYVYAGVKANATRARLSDGGNGVADASIGVPFPLPKNGKEAIWNALLRFRGSSLRRNSFEANVTAKGSYTITHVKEDMLYSYAAKGATFAQLKNVGLYLRRSFTQPARMAGTVFLVHETINMVKEKRHSWLYTPGLRRVTRAPYVAYDSPTPGTEGLEMADQFDMYNGAIDRYDWKLAGKVEMYVPYNAYKLHQGGLKYKDILRPKHIDMARARYELHRVWKVEARLRKGSRHLYAKRVFYLDEDSWQPLLIDLYDKGGKLWRVTEGHVINYYEVPLIWTTLETIYDLWTRRYRATGLNNRGPEHDFTPSFSTRDFSPSSLRRRGFR